MEVAVHPRRHVRHETVTRRGADACERVHHRVAHPEPQVVGVRVKLLHEPNAGLRIARGPRSQGDDAAHGKELGRPAPGRLLRREAGQSQRDRVGRSAPRRARLRECVREVLVHPRARQARSAREKVFEGLSLPRHGRHERPRERIAGRVRRDPSQGRCYNVAVCARSSVG